MIPTGNNTSNIKTLKVFYFATIIGAIVFAGVIISVAKFSPLKEQVLNDYLDYVLILASVFAVIFYMIARNSFARKVSDIRNSSVNTLEKLNLYRTALISYMGLCEAPALLAFVFFLLTNNYLLLLIGAIMLLAMAIKFPSRERLIADMSLDGKEQQELV